MCCAYFDETSVVFPPLVSKGSWLILFIYNFIMGRSNVFLPGHLIKSILQTQVVQYGWRVVILGSIQMREAKR